MRVLRKILIIISIIILLIAAIGFLFFPSQISVERSTIILRNQSFVFDYLQDMRNWNKWSPWYGIDPNAKYTFEGPPAGQGATIKWESEVREVGSGSLSFSEVKPDSVIYIDLNFLKNGTAKSVLYCASEGDATRVKWSFHVEAGVNPLLRIMGSFMDGIIGKEYEKGLSTLKMKLEAERDSTNTINH